MTTLENRPNSAVLVIDYQNGVVAEAFERNKVAANINRVVGKAREAGVPVVWIQDTGNDRTPGSEAWQVVPELDPKADEPRLDKEYGDSFEATDLEKVLAERGVGRVYITGAQTDACIRSTLHGAFTRGYDTVLVTDAHTTEDLRKWEPELPGPEQVIAHTNVYWKYHGGPGRDAVIVTSDEVDFA